MTNTRTAAIARARKDVSIYYRFGCWEVWRWINDTYTKSKCASHHAARTIRAQILIDTTLDLLGLEADITYTGGSWTTYIPKEGE